TARPLPGQQALPREFIARHQRARIIAALAEETAEKGYRAVTVAHIVKRAGIARNTFYENFGSKEECFLAAQDYAMTTALERVVDAAGEIDVWPGRVRAGLNAFLVYVSEEPALARTCMVEALSAGPASMKYYEESQQAFVSLFQLGRDVSPHGRELPDTLEEALIGGVFWIVYQRLTAAEPDSIADLMEELTEFILTPYLGPDEASEIAAGSTVPASDQGTRE
ncbi:MAG TPA: TetR/AcrR family transcriptional regulator, partial [Solirubrobacterales bacterium]|nr:TetR/AcrR family transcriptional regulator [Solirubrobacterales bacterium]